MELVLSVELGFSSFLAIGPLLFLRHCFPFGGLRSFGRTILVQSTACFQCCFEFFVFLLHAFHFFGNLVQVEDVFGYYTYGRVWHLNLEVKLSNLPRSCPRGKFGGNGYGVRHALDAISVQMQSAPDTNDTVAALALQKCNILSCIEQSSCQQIAVRNRRRC